MIIQIKNAKLKMNGNSYWILVPMDFIKNGMIDVNQEYDVIIKPIKKKEVDLSVETIKDLAIDAVMKETKSKV
jgi:virulence-associated protein VagC